MKKAVILGILVSTVLCLWSCAGNLNSETGIQNEENDGLFSKTDQNNEYSYYILQSVAGNRESNLQELNAISSQIFLYKENGDTTNVIIKYTFENQVGKDRHEFKMRFDTVLNQSKEDGVLSFNENGISALCSVDGKTAEFADAYCSGTIGDSEAGSRISIAGNVNGYPFILNINSLSSTAEDFTPKFAQGVIEDLMPYVEMVITNECKEDVNVLIRGEGQLINFIIPSKATQKVKVHNERENFPENVLVEITYHEDNRVVLESDAILSSECFVKGEEGELWYLRRHGNGSIVPRYFTREHFSVKEPVN